MRIRKQLLAGIKVEEQTGVDLLRKLPQEDRPAAETQGGLMSTPILPGRCNQCGECCKYINLGRVAQFREEQKEYIRAHGVIEDQGFFLVPFRCPHLIELIRDGTGTIKRSHCNIHDTKPKICQKFDGKRYKNHTIFWVPKSCTMAVK